jgi:8-oxo-dGDP phosphatase
MQLRDEPFSWPVVSSDLRFRGGVADFRTDHLVDGDATFAREVIAHPGAAAAVAVDDDDRVLVIQQYRHPVQARLVEFPAGILDVEGEPPLEAAKRELREEGHIEADRWSPLLIMLPSPGMNTERVYIFLAEGVRAASMPDGFEPAHEEIGIERAWVPLDDLVEAVLDGSVQNGLTIAGSLALWHQRHEK